MFALYLIWDINNFHDYCISSYNINTMVFFYVAMIIHAEHSENDDTQITLRLQEEKQVSRLSHCSYKLAENDLI